MAVIIIIVVRYCYVKNKSQPSSTHQTQILSTNLTFVDNAMSYDDPPLYYTENINAPNRLTSPILHGHNSIAISEEIRTNITPLDTTYETISNDVTTSLEQYYYVSRPESDSTAVYIVPNRDEGLSEQSIQLKKSVAYNYSTTQSTSSTNMGDISLEQSIQLNENVAYNVVTKRSVDYLKIL